MNNHNIWKSLFLLAQQTIKSNLYHAKKFAMTAVLGAHFVAYILVGVIPKDRLS